jgi:hypothetical protein
MTQELLTLVTTVGVPSAIIIIYMWKLAPAIEAQTKAFNDMCAKIEGLAISTNLFNMIKELLIMQSKALGVPEKDLQRISKLELKNGTTDGDNTSSRD